MKYIFPGMDPFIQASGLWESFHGALIAEIAWKLAKDVPQRYLVRAGVRSYITFERRGGTALAEAPGAAQPITMRAYIEEEHREAFINIYDANPPGSSSTSDGNKKERRLVTSIEVLAPANKQPKTRGWKVYQRKRRACLLSEVNLVEIDLVRGGRRMPMTDPWPDSVYLLVARGKDSPVCKAWPVNLQEPVPTIPVPLAVPDPDVALNLQPLIEDIYQRFRYEQSIDYAVPLAPPLEPADAVWVEQRLRKRPGRAKSAP